MNKLQKKHLLEKIMDILFLSTIFFIPIEISLNLRFLKFISPYKISILLLSLVFVYNFVTYYKEELQNIKKSLIEMYYRYKYVIITVTIYFLFDLISLLWTKDVRFALRKYITIIPMIVLFLYSCLYYFRVNDDLSRYQKTRYVALSMGLMAFALSLATWIVYLVNNRTYYILRMSLSPDYNQFTLSIILGFLCGMYFILTTKDIQSKLVSFFCYTLTIMPLFHLSGSRRTMLIYLPLYAVLSIFLLVELNRKKNRNLMILAIAIVVSVPLLNQMLIEGYNVHSSKVYKKMYDESVEAGKELVSAAESKEESIIHDFKLEQNLQFKSDTIKTGEAFQARNTLWKIATDEIKSYNTIELLIGKGASHQRDVFRTDEAVKVLFPDEQPQEFSGYIHPHSMIFVELLNGGIIKLIIVLAIIISVLYYAYIAFVNKTFYGVLLILLYGAVFLSSQVIDSIFGLLESRLTWIFFILVLGIVSYNGKDLRRELV